MTFPSSADFHVRSRLKACAALAFLLTACHASPRPAITPRLAPVQQLRHDIDTLLSAPAFDRSFWAVLVNSLATGETLYTANARKLLLPASNMKIVTLAAAADRLGWDYTYETRLQATASIEAGILNGDVVAVGSGDPSIGVRDGPHVFDEWAEQLKARGLRRIEGRIIGDDDAFDDEALGAGWTWDDLGEGYSAGVSALQFNENTIRATIVPGRRAGDPAVATIEPVGSGVIVDNAVTTAPPGSATSIDALRLPGSAHLALHGVVSLDAAPAVRTFSVENPTLFFVTVLRNTLIAHGIDVRGPAVDIDDVGDAPSRDAPSLVFHRSPPLSELAVTLMKASQNLYAETFLKTLGAQAAAPTFAGGLAATRAAMEMWGVEPGGLIMRDGSGLSRYNYATAQTLVAILTHIDRDAKLRGPFEAALPIAGKDGTLSRRMAATAAEGNARAKTGSLSHARALSGYVRTADGEPVVFSIIANNFDAAAAVVDQATDAIVVRLAEFTRRGSETHGPRNSPEHEPTKVVM